MDDPSAPPEPESGTATPPADTLPPEDRPPVRGGLPIPRGLLWALALAVVVLTIASWMALSAEQPAAGPAGHGDHPVTTDLTGGPAPAARFEVLDGQPASLSDLRGSPVVLNFWSATCVPCITEMPAFEQVHRDYGDRVRFVGLAVADNETSARGQQRRTGVTYPLGFDPEGQIARSFGIISIPATVLIDREGTIVHVTQGPALTAPSLTGLITAKLRP